MKIHSDFECGNIKLLGIEGNNVFLQNDLRGNGIDWFYWAFCVEGAESKSLTFNFDKEWVGYYGPAVSHDLINWHWLDSRDSESSFSYTFGPDEKKVYFAHDTVYSPKRFLLLADEKKLNVRRLCRTPKGRDVPFFTLGNGKKNIIITSRHHACESTGTYILEGFVREFSESPINDVLLFVVPMVDYDGVCDGDQGKGRLPHDHNRDYIDSPIHPEVKAIVDCFAQNSAYMAFDFHSPAHRGGNSDNVFIVRKMPEKKPLFDSFGTLFEKNCTSDTMIYKMSNDKQPNKGWNRDSTPTFSTFFNLKRECKLAFSLETTYFGTPENKVSTEKLINTGRAFCRTVRQFMREEGEIVDPPESCKTEIFGYYR